MRRAALSAASNDFFKRKAPVAQLHSRPPRRSSRASASAAGFSDSPSGAMYASAFSRLRGLQRLQRQNQPVLAHGEADSRSLRVRRSPRSARHSVRRPAAHSARQDLRA